MTSPLLLLTVRGADRRDVLAAAVSSGWLPARPPDTLRLDDGPGDWTERYAATGVDASVSWGPIDDEEATAAHGVGVSVLGRRGSVTTAEMLERLAAVPFAEATVTGLHPEWSAPPTSYRAPSLGGGMPPHGWLCAFRGADAHRRLVSRRWLEWGPWRLHRGPEDLSVVEFHDGPAESATALAQARPGHETMGIADRGGYIQDHFVYGALPRGLFEPSTGLLKVVVHGRTPGPRELLEACALRIEPREVQPGPVRQVAFVFMEEGPAEAALGELAARELECRAIVGAREVILDGSGRAPPRPAWTTADPHGGPTGR